MCYSQGAVFYGTPGDDFCPTKEKLVTRLGKAVKATVKSTEESDEQGEPLIFYLVHDKRIETEVRSLLKSGATPLGRNYLDYGHELYVCPKCNMLSERFAFQLKTGWGKTYEPDYRCERCGERLGGASFVHDDSLNHRQSRVAHTDGMPCLCPECGRDALVCEDGGFWD